MHYRSLFLFLFIWQLNFTAEKQVDRVPSLLTLTLHRAVGLVEQRNKFIVDGIENLPCELKQPLISNYISNYIYKHWSRYIHATAQEIYFEWDQVGTLRISPNTHYFARYENNNIILYEKDMTGCVVAEILFTENSKGCLWAVAFSLDNQYLIGIQKIYSIFGLRVWELATRQEVFRYSDRVLFAEENHRSYDSTYSSDDGQHSIELGQDGNTLRVHSPQANDVISALYEYPPMRGFLAHQAYFITHKVDRHHSVGSPVINKLLLFAISPETIKQQIVDRLKKSSPCGSKDHLITDNVTLREIQEFIQEPKAEEPVIVAAQPSKQQQSNCCTLL